MKSTSVLLLATSVVAEYGYGAPAASSAPSKIGYTTVNPGHGKQPVTVTAQYQPVPTYVNGKWSSYEAISTVITDGYGNKITVTKGDQDVTVYHTQKTLTHTLTEGYAKPTGYYGGKSPYSNSTSTKTWHELYEEVHEVPYNHLGPHAIPGYSGNPRCEDNKDEQSVEVKQYTGGKWRTYAQTFTYSAPKPSVTSYDAPGTYTIPANDVTIDHPTTVAVEQTYHAEANKPVTYGGKTTDVTKPTTITAAYAAYETKGTVTKTVVYSKTITCNGAGKYTIQEPKTTVYPHDTTITYPTVTEYSAGVYHHPAETVTITKAHEPYTCKYEQTATYPVPSYPSGKPSSVEPYGAGKTSTPTYPDSSESTPAYPAGPEYPDHTSTPTYPDHDHTPKPSSTERPHSHTPRPSHHHTPGYPEPTPSPTQPHYPDPSSDYEEPAESYGHAHAGYVRRGGVLERRKANAGSGKAAARPVILV